MCDKSKHIHKPLEVKTPRKKMAQVLLMLLSDVFDINNLAHGRLVRMDLDKEGELVQPRIHQSSLKSHTPHNPNILFRLIRTLKPCSSREVKWLSELITALKFGYTAFVENNLGQKYEYESTQSEPEIAGIPWKDLNLILYVGCDTHFDALLEAIQIWEGENKVHYQNTLISEKDLQALKGLKNICLMNYYLGRRVAPSPA